MGIILDSSFVIHFCHFIQTAVPSIINLTILMVAGTFTLLVPAGMVNLIYQVARGLAYPAFLKHLQTPAPGDASSPDFEAGFKIETVRAEIPFAFAVGVFRKKILISDGIRNLLTPQELRAVILHEAGHLTMNHPLKRIVVKALLKPLLFLPHREKIWNRYKVITEIAADEYAISSGAEPVTLAGAILKTAKTLSSVPAPLLTGFSNSQVKERIKALLGKDETGVSERPNTRESVLWGGKNYFILSILVIFLILPALYRPGGELCSIPPTMMEKTENPRHLLSICTDVRCETCTKCRHAS
jgi:hypothetical protein